MRYCVITKMTSKIACGLVMAAPAAVLYSYSLRESDDETWGCILTRGAKKISTGVAIGVVMAYAWLGAFHVVDGLYDLAPVICPREH